ISSVSVSAPPSSCYPSGWDRIKGISRLNFSPGVCPEGWTTRWDSMAHTHTLGPTSAYCCDRFVCTIFFAIAYIAFLLMMHTPWTVTWYASNTANLTPKLPTLASLMIVPTWTTGQTIPDGVYDYKPPRLESGPDFTKDSLFMFLVAGIPVIVFVLICSCVFCCIRSCRKKRRQKKA
ncbi:hypothetical protein BDP81DRAFT_273348, partial [Colletotrichum phormii]